MSINDTIIQEKQQGKSHAEIADIVNEKFHLNLTKDAIRKRYARAIKSKSFYDVIEPAEYEEHFANGEVALKKNVFFKGEVEKTPENILRILGYNPSEWEVIKWRIGEWDTSMKDKDGKPMKSRNQTVSLNMKPIAYNDITMEDALDIYRDMVEDIGVYNKTKTSKPKIDNDLLKELTGIELHLGKMAWAGDTGQDYDKDIATIRFYRIVQEIINQQSIEQASECLYCIGNDFFNSDTIDATTTKGTPQTNDLRWKKMFKLGLELNVMLINSLLDNFETVHIRLQSGNHDKMSSFYLYETLWAYYRNEDRIEFSHDLKDVQCFLWGKCGIFFTHGDSNLKRTIKSIPAEFYKEWGMTTYRELHLGHLHKEVVVDDEGGMITRRVGSPTGTDQWHYEERYMGATQKYQTFLWHKKEGLKSIQYINF